MIVKHQDTVMINGKKFLRQVKSDYGFVVAATVSLVITSFALWVNFIPFIVLGSIVMGLMLGGFMFTTEIDYIEIR